MCMVDRVKLKPSITMDKNSYLCGSECGIVVGARRDDLSILETAEMFLVGFFHTTVSRVYRERSEKEKI